MSKMNYHKKFLLAAGLLTLIVALFLRIYQLFIINGFLQFDIFVWLLRSKRTILTGYVGNLPGMSELWGFHIFNSVYSIISGVNILEVYLILGSIISILGTVILFITARKIFNSPTIGLICAFLYAFGTTLISRSVMYLPETITYIIGPIILWCLAGLFFENEPKYILLLFIFNIFYLNLHQGGVFFWVLCILGVLIYGLKNASTVIDYIKNRRIFLLLFVVLILIISIFFGTFYRISSHLIDSGHSGQSVGVPEPWANIVEKLTAPLLLFSLLGFILGIKLSKNKEERGVIGLSFFVFFVFFSFLYLIAKFTDYRLVPWRFYTWTYLYMILFSSAGIFFLRNNIGKRKTLIVFFATLIILFLSTIPNGLVYEDMVSADFSTLNSMTESLKYISNGSIIITSSANQPPTKFIYGMDNIVLPAASSKIFVSESYEEKVAIINLSLKSKEKNKNIDEYFDLDFSNRSIYILISKFQLRQRPAATAWWNNNAVMNTNLSTFNKNFSRVFEDNNILLLKSEYVNLN